MTNREIYVRIAELGSSPPQPELGLESYLRALLALCQRYRSAEGLTPEQFLTVLERAFHGEESPEAAPEGQATPGFARFSATLGDQIRDLREMKAAGILDRPLIGFGVKAPSGRSWYNFQPSIYLECACDGCLGGWEPGDDTGRDFVPGLVAVFDEEGRCASVPAEEVERPVLHVSFLPWELLTDFVQCGQMYE